MLRLRAHNIELRFNALFSRMRISQCSVLMIQVKVGGKPKCELWNNVYLMQATIWKLHATPCPNLRIQCEARSAKSKLLFVWNSKWPPSDCCILILLLLGAPPSTETPYDKYPIIVRQGGNSKALVVQDFAYGKYLGHLKVGFDADGHVTSWSGNPILLDSSIPKDRVVLQQVQRMKIKVAKFSEVRWTELCKTP